MSELSEAGPQAKRDKSKLICKAAQHVCNGEIEIIATPRFVPRKVTRELYG
jgi:hypothetical protein